IRFTPVDGHLVGTLVDNLDGTYTQGFQADPGKLGAVDVDVAGTTVSAANGAASGGWELSAFLGFFDLDRSLPVDDNLVFGLRAGREVAHNLSVEGELGATGTDDLAGNRGHVFQVSGNVLYHFTGPASTWRPFVTVGAGWVAFKGFSTDESALAANLGLGL